MVTGFVSRARALLLLCLLIWAGCGDDGPSGTPSDVIVPEAWRGLWEITYSAYTCSGDSLIDVSQEIRAACPGQTLEQFLGIESQNVELQCTGGFTDTDLTAHCSGRTNLVCEVTLSADMNATRVDTLFTGSAVLYTTLDCDGDRETDCETYLIEGSRIDPAPTQCGDAPAALSPPLKKALYGTSSRD